MEQRTKDYLKRWGHLPMWEDWDGFRERVKIAEEKAGIKKQGGKCKGCNAEAYDEITGFCLGCTRAKHGK